MFSFREREHVQERYSMVCQFHPGIYHHLVDKYFHAGGDYLQCRIHLGYHQQLPAFHDIRAPGADEAPVLVTIFGGTEGMNTKKNGKDEKELLHWLGAR